MAEDKEVVPVKEKKAAKKTTSRSIEPVGLVLPDPNAVLSLRKKNGKRANWTIDQALRPENFKQLKEKSQKLVTGEGVTGDGVVIATELVK